ncbi:MAG: PEGA domain-containing protein [Deltaproteobacteria bacterium]|nr:PEGA domain-containing protein [Deltaproteobacteria bacterium]MCW5802266.1 PEGA domain-containing protein [Deltaproteobacteria bacterium]
MPAQPVDALKKAQTAFDQAQVDYLQGKFDEAAQGFEEAYSARQFPQFLYNVGTCHHMKGKKASDIPSYEKAVSYYRQYLEKDPQAADKVKVEKAIGILETEITRLKELKATTPPVGSGSEGSGSAAAQVAPSPEVEKLEAKPRGLIVIESEPQNATIYLDSQKKGPFATTPWSGSLEGEHKVIIEKRGFMISESTVSADPSKLFVLKAVLGPEASLGWIDITSNVVGAEIFIDDKAAGPFARTPHSKNIKPGKHTFWITAEGYDEYKEEIEIIRGGTHEIKAVLKGSPVGKVNVVGLGIEDSAIYIDGKLACERGPCLKAVTQGDHTITVTRKGMKPYSRRVNIQAKTETSIKVNLAPKPSRGDAVVAYILAAGFGGGGVFLGLQANKYRDELKKGIADGTTGTNVPPDSNDPRFFKGKAFAIAADATFVLAGITALTAIYYTFRDKGPPSTGLIDVRALAITPQIGREYAGLGMEVRW